MAAEPRVAAEDELSVEDGVQDAPPLAINLERILSASTMKEWWSLLRASVGPELSQLHRDILSFCKAHELTPHQIQLRKDALARIERAVHDIWPAAETHLFGSTATGLALPWSDIDLVIMPPKHLGPAWRKPTPKSWQNALSRKLNGLGQCRSIEKIPFAKVPLLKVVFKSGIACDISFDVRNSHAGVSVIRHFVEQYQACRPLCLVLKFFLGRNNLNELRNGGLGSFCLNTMVISHLQKTASIVEAGYGDLGTLLLSFFAYYSNIHSYNTDVVSTRPGFCGSKQDKGWVSQKNPQLLAVEDPLDPTSDIGKGSYRIEQVRNKFSVAHRAFLTHWHNEHIWAQIDDITSNPNQGPAAPSPERSNRSKRGGRKKRRATRGQDEFILTQQPALKIPRRHHPQQGSGLVTKSQQDRTLHNSGGPHLTGFPPTSNRLRTGHQEDNSCSLQNAFAPVIPAQHGVDLWRRSQGNARGCNSLEANSSPEIEPRKNALKHQAAADSSRAQENSAKGSHYMEANFTPRRKPRSLLDHQFAENNCRPNQSVHSHLRRDGMDALGTTENQDEAINIDFWESQLITKSKPKKSALRQEENLGRCYEVSRSQDSSIGSGVLETNSTPIIRPTKKGPKHQTTGKGCPVESGHSHLTQEGLDARVVRGNRDERILVDFWESQLATRSKPRKTSLSSAGAGVTDSLPQAEPSLHHKLSQRISKIQPTVLDEDLLQHRCAEGSNEQVQADQAQYGIQILSKTQDVKSVENCNIEGNTKHDLAVQIAHSEQSQNVLRLDFWEAQLTSRAMSHKGTLENQLTPGGAMEGALRITSAKSSSMDDASAGADGVVLANQANHLDRPEHDRDVSGGSGDETVEAQLTPRLKAGNRSSKQLAAGCEDEDAQPERKSYLEQQPPPQHSEVLEISPDERKLVEFWETYLDPKPEYKKGLLNDQQATGGGDEVLGRSLVEKKLVEFWETHLNPQPKPNECPLTDQQAAGCGDKEEYAEISQDHGFDRILVDFWEANLTPSLKSRKCALTHDRMAGEEDLQSVQGTHRELPTQDGALVGRSEDEAMLSNFWEAFLNPALSRKCYLRRKSTAVV